MRKRKFDVNKLISKILAAVMVVGTLPTILPQTTAVASQYDSYVDPAEIWIDSQGNIDDLERNAIVTQESQYCNQCGKNVTMTIWRVPEYTKSGASAAEAQGLICSDGYLYYKQNGNPVPAPTNFCSPLAGGKYTGYHYTKSYCPACSFFNSGDGMDTYAYGKNVFITNPCKSDTPLPEDVVDTYEQVNSKQHRHYEKSGTYCPFCNGTTATKTSTLEKHDGIIDIEPQIGNHRFYEKNDCYKCGYTASEYYTAWVSVTGYIGAVDGKDHSVTVNDYCDSSVSATVKYMNSAGNYTATAPAYDDEGTYNVDYKVDYTYSGETMTEYGTAQIVLYDTSSSGSSGSGITVTPVGATPSPDGTGGTGGYLITDGTGTVIYIPASHTHDYEYKYTVAPTSTELGYEVWQCSCGVIEKRNETAAVPEETHVHDYSYLYTVGATSTELGYEVWQCDCGALNLCNYTATTSEETHNFVYKWTVDATCRSDGYEVWQCDGCGAIQRQNFTSKTAHNYVYKYTVEPTEDALGYEIWQCDGCGDIEQRNYTQLTVTGSCTHDYVYRYAVEPTCTDMGFEIWECSECGVSERRNYKSATGHSYKATVVREANCNQTGVTLYICDNCGAGYTETTPITNTHDYEWVTSTEATCTKDGLKKKVCSICGSIGDVETIPATGHSYHTSIIEPTCTSPGYLLYECDKCGNAYTERYTEPQGHKWDDGTIVTSSTCLGEGVKEYRCTECNEIKLEAVSAAGHTPGAPATCTEPQTCTACGAVLELPTGHTYGAETVPPTCTSFGYTKYTCVEDDDSYIADYTDKLPHEYEAAVTQPTCTAMGYTTYTCKNCGDSYVSDYTDKLPHSYKGAVTQPTCTAMGYTTYTCEDCGDSYVSDYTDVLPHNYSKQVIEPTCTSQGYTIYTCPDCGKEYIGDEKESVPHTFRKDITKPTCTAMGFTTNTCEDCGYSYVSDYTDVLPHEYEAEVTDPTCTTHGYTTYTCKNCGASYVSDYTEPAPHDYDEEVTAPTCTELGFTTKTCKDCGDVVVTDYVETIPHDYEETVTAPTCLEMGYTTYVCRDCGNTTKGNYTNPKGHTYRKDVTAPTCTAMGYTTNTCEDCGYSYVSDYVDAHGHDYEQTVTTSTCTDIGYTTNVCRVCGDTFISDEQAKAAHDFEITVIPPTCTEVGCSIYKCRNCGEEYKADETAPTGHSPSAWIIDVPATIRHDGSKHIECTVCGTVLDTATLPKLTDSGRTDEEGRQVIGDYTIRITDKGSVPVFNSIIAIDEEDNITIALPGGRLITADDVTTIEVKRTETDAPAEGIHINVSDTNGNAATGETDADGILVIPNGESSTGTDNGTITDGENTFVVSVTDKNGAVIPYCVITSGDNFSIDVKLPDGTAFDRDNRVTVTVTDENGAPVKGLRINVIGDGDHIENGYTNVNGQSTLPITNQALTDDNGRANVGETVGNTIHDYIVTVNDEERQIKDALITLDAANETVLVCLPAGKIISYDNRTTVTVKTSDDEPVEGWSVIVYNKDGSNERTELTDENGTVVVPPYSEAPISKPTETPEPQATPRPGVIVPDATDEPGAAEPTETSGTTATEKPGATEQGGTAATDTPNITGEPTIVPEPDDFSRVWNKSYDYYVYVWDNDGQIRADAETGLVKLHGDGNITVTLPEGKMLDETNRVHVMVVTETDETRIPVRGITVTAVDKSGASAEDITDRYGIAVVPVTNTDTTDLNGNATVKDADGTVYNVNTASEDGTPIEGAEVTVEDGKVSVELPDGTVIDHNDRTVVTVTNTDEEPVKAVPVKVTDNEGNTRNEITDDNGKVTVPPLTEDVTASDGNGVVHGIHSYAVTVEDERGAVENAEIVLDEDGGITVTLPDGKTIDYGNRTTVTVTDKESGTPTEGVTVMLRDGTGASREGVTSVLGKVTIPPLNEDMSDSDGSGSVTDKKDALPTETPDPDATADPNATEAPKTHDYNVSVRDNDGAIPGAIIKTDDAGRITVTLPDGRKLDGDNKVEVTVTDKESGEPVKDVPVTVSDRNGNSAGDTTDRNGIALVPINDTAATDADGKADVETKDDAGKLAGYTIVVENNDGKIENANAAVKDGRVSVVLPDGKTLTTSNKTKVTVTDKDNQPVKAMPVTITDSANTVKSATTNSQGYVLLPETTSGGGGGGSSSGGGGGGGSSTSAYVITVTDKDGKTVSVSRSSYSAKGVTLTLPKDYTLDDGNYYTVTVKDRTGKAIEDYAITLKTKDGKTSNDGTTDKNGIVVIPPQGTEHILYVEGYDGGEFKPDGNMARAEAAAVFARLIAHDKDESIKGKPSFADTDHDAWYAPYVGYVEKYGIIEGYDKDTFKPDGKITRAEFVTMTVRFHKLYDTVTYGVNTTKYNDVDSKFWGIKDISYATEIGWLNGYADGTFKPNANITRAEVVTVVNNATGRQADEEYINKNLESLEKFTDLKTNTHWAFYDIMEAANTHTGKTTDDGEVWTK